MRIAWSLLSGLLSPETAIPPRTRTQVRVLFFFWLVAREIAPVLHRPASRTGPITLFRATGGTE
jgi:hypothetical protein